MPATVKPPTQPDLFVTPPAPPRETAPAAPFSFDGEDPRLRPRALDAIPAWLFIPGVDDAG